MLQSGLITDSYANAESDSQTFGQGRGVTAPFSRMCILHLTSVLNIPCCFKPNIKRGLQSHTTLLTDFLLLLGKIYVLYKPHVVVCCG